MVHILILVVGAPLKLIHTFHSSGQPNRVCTSLTSVEYLDFHSRIEIQKDSFNSHSAGPRSAIGRVPDS